MSKQHTAVTQNQSYFATSVHADIKRSTFFRNSSLKTTFNCGELVPIYIDEVLPGDTFDFDIQFISRLTTPIFPTMDILYLDYYAFFVPNRIVWDDWEQLNGENKTGAWVPNIRPALVPTVGAADVILSKSLADYYGLPVGINCKESYGTEVSALPFRGYLEIWNEWFRDQNTQASYIVYKNNTNQFGNRSINSGLLKVNKKHDYFTSCLPSPQKGESMLIPISIEELIPVITGDNHIPFDGVNRKSLNWMSSINGGPLNVNGNLKHNSDGSTAVLPGDPAGVHSVIPSNLWANAVGMQLSGSTISDLRTAFQIQKLFEKDARGGTRYQEMLKAHFGVEAQDYRLQRPEFLGQYSTSVGMQQVAQTSSTDTTSPQGNMSAFSLTYGKNKLFKKSFTEHGYLHIFAVARHPKTYQNGIDRFWTRRERFDFYYPTLAHISEQPVYNKEIFVTNDKNKNNEIFGYNEAWADYRYKPNRVTGQFRSGIENSLDNWHYADYYNDLPKLSSDWITDNSAINVDRTVALSSTLHDQILLDITFLNKATRPMPVNSIPGYVDHF